MCEEFPNDSLPFRRPQDWVSVFLEVLGPVIDVIVVEAYGGIGVHDGFKRLPIEQVEDVN